MGIRTGKRAISKRKGKHYSEPQENKIDTNVYEEEDIIDIMHFPGEDIGENKETENVNEEIDISDIMHFPDEDVEEHKETEEVNEGIDISDVMNVPNEEVQEHKEEENAYFPSEEGQEDRKNINEKRVSKKKPKYKIFIIGLLVIGIIAGGSYFMLNKEEVTKPVEIQKVNDKGEITEEYAKQLAVGKFKELNEEVKSKDLEILRIDRDGEEYYYINSSQNSLEIRVLSGEITRVNSVPVQQ